MHSPNIDLQHSTLDARLQMVDFEKATPSTLKQLTEQALSAADEFLQTLPKAENSTQDFEIIEKFNELNRNIERHFGVLSHLNSVMSSDEIRQAHHEILPKLSDFGVKVGQSAALYQLYQMLHDGFDTLPKHAQSSAQKRAVDKALQDFVLSGVALDDDKKAKFAEIQSALSLASAKFSDNVLDATRQYVRALSEDELSGIGENGRALLKTAAEDAKARGVAVAGDYAATLDIPMYLTVMQFADNRALREELYRAYSTRASEISDAGKFDNAPIMREIIALREQKAAILGMQSYAEYSLAKKMANDSDEVAAFLLGIAAAAKNQALLEKAELEQFAKKYGIDEVQAWDVAYLAEKLRLEKFSLTSDELRAFFPLPVVLEGLFDICRELFGIRIEMADKADFRAWHKDVLFCQIFDEQSGALLGGLYLDLYARSGKRGGAWLDDFQGRSVTDDKTVLPVGFIVGNFAPPMNDKPSLLSFDEVTTLFHEFGHALHHLLTAIDVNDVAGISGVEWDAVELPSQFLENFAIDADGITRISRHIDTNAPLPDDKRAALIAAKNFHTGLQTLRQLEFGLFDLRLHSRLVGKEALDEAAILQILDEVRAQIAVITPPAYNRFANSFSHIFSGGYACGYYSYMWAEVLSADAFAKFAENGVFDAATGRAFRQEILAQGSARSARENFAAFRGRDAAIDALLISRGLVAA